jgi:hypothetical protein
MIAVVMTVLALAACDDNNWDKDAHKPAIAFEPLLSPSQVIVASIFPAQLPIVTVSSTECGGGVRAFSTAFDLVLVPTSGSFSVDRVTFRLLDGTSLGGPMVTIGSPQLVTMFGTTLVSARRTFPFSPRFGCSNSEPKSMDGEVRLVDRFGTVSTIAIRARF